MHKFKRFRGRYAKAMAWLQKVYQYQPGLVAHWQLVAFTAGRGLWGPDDGRPSRPVLRAAGGETPPADSPRQPRTWARLFVDLCCVTLRDWFEAQITGSPWNWRESRLS
jgi:hypothetical protein